MPVWPLRMLIILKALAMNETVENRLKRSTFRAFPAI